MAAVHYSYGNLADYFSIIVADNDPVRALVQLNGETFPITVIFIPTPNPETNQNALKWHMEEGVVNFTFYGWSNALGSTTSEVNTRIGTTASGETIYIVAMHHKVGKANHLTMQFVLGHSTGGTN